MRYGIGRTLLVLGAIVVAAGGCSRAPDAAGEWQCDGEWVANYIANAVREKDAQARMVVPAMPPLPDEAVQPSKLAANVFSKFRVSLRSDGTCTVSIPLHEPEEGTWTQSRWRVTLTNKDGQTEEFQLLNADAGEMHTSNGEPLRFKRVR